MEPLRKPLLPPTISQLAADWRRSFVHASTIKALVNIRGVSEADILQDMARDPTARLIARGAVTPLKASDFPGSTLTAFKALAPRAASIAVLGMGQEVGLSGVDTVRVSAGAELHQRWLGSLKASRSKSAKASSPRCRLAR